MSRYETLMARDGHTFSAYIAKAAGTARGGVVILQEIFGLNPFICRVVDRCAAEGYLAIAPALFDRIERGLVLGYSSADVQQGVGVRAQIDTATALRDIAAAAAVVRHAGKLAVLGFCWGGRLAFAAASQLPFSAAVCYYGGGMVEELPGTPRCATMLHFGAQDRSIPPDEIERVRTAFPQGVYHVYAAAGHAFSNDDRAQNFNAEAAALAEQRTSGFLAQHIG
jgi:carboxymethylenebutenolidase